MDVDHIYPSQPQSIECLHSTHNIEEEKEIQKGIIEKNEILELETFEILNEENLAQS